jgi:hypothetical protein
MTALEANLRRTPAERVQAHRQKLSELESLKQTLGENGFVILPGILTDEMVTHLITELDSTSVRHGMRNLANTLEPIRRLALSNRILNIVTVFLNADAVLVRSLYFDKTPDNNWPVAWHQDRTIAVREKREVAGFNTWTLKDGIPHVQPPAAFMEGMVTLRIHLDDTDEANGALRITAGSHRLGYLTAQQIQQFTSEREIITCSVPRGGVLAMKPLLVHSSRRAKSPSHRRVIHLEYAAGPLPGGLHWAEA